MTRPTEPSRPGRRRHNSPGITARHHRVTELEHLLRLEEAEQHPLAAPSEIDEGARRRFNQIARQRPAVLKQFKRYGQTSLAPDRRDINPWVELAAARAEPEVRDLMNRLLSHGRGRHTDRGEPLAALTILAGVPSSASICHATQMLRDTPIAQFALGNPPRVSRTSTYDLIHSIAKRHDPDLAVEANVALIKRLRERHPTIGRVAVVDGTKVEAHVPQRSPVDKRHSEILHHGRQRNVKPFLYSGRDHHITDYWVGYKEMLLSDRASGLPLTWSFDPGNDERSASRSLLHALFRYWPDCPLEYVVGDGLYGRDSQYLHDLEFSWGVHPVFPLPSDISPAMPHAATRGVPACRHGLMKRRNHDGYINPDRRRELGIPRNQLVPDDARIRYVCPIGDPTCPKQTVYTRDDGRLYPYLPHDGLENDLYFALRQALQLGRNSIEMRFAHLKGGGVANTGQARFKMRSDRAYEWLISLNFVLATAKRVAHETGGYEAALESARSLGLLD